MGMTLAMGLATLGWQRSWGARERAALACRAWQAELLAESGLACAVDLAADRSSVAPTADSGQDSSGSAPGRRLETARSECAFRGGDPGTFSWEPPAGDLLVSVRATGTAGRGRPLERTLEAVLSAAPDPDLFAPALVLFARGSGLPELRGRVRGNVRVALSEPLPAGFEPQGNGRIGFYVPASVGDDTVRASLAMVQAFRSDEARLGGATYTPSRPPPAGDRLVHTLGAVVLEGPRSGDPWILEGPRELFVEGDLELRGRVVLRGWTVRATGSVTLSDDAALLGTTLYCRGSLALSDRSRLQGQAIATGRLELAGTARIDGVASVAPGGADAPGIYLLERSRAELYGVALGGAGRVEIGSEAVFSGVAVAGGLLRIDGALRGVGVAGRLDAGEGDRNAMGTGSVDRDALPPDLAFPLGLPGSVGLRIASWRTL